jgi:hypothetical protein
MLTREPLGDVAELYAAVDGVWLIDNCYLSYHNGPRG